MKHSILATLELTHFREEMFDGDLHLVAPVILLVEGVHSGSGGSLYYSPQEISAHVETWNGVPVVVSHPMDAQGTPLSANSPEHIERQAVGTLFHVHYDSNGAKLKGEMWINILKADKVSTGLVASIRSRTQVEISTGMGMDEISESGNWRGEAYEGIATDFRPDHLALLVGQEGACSWIDGCGIRANKGTDSKATGKQEGEPVDNKDNLILLADVADEEKPTIRKRILNALGIKETASNLSEKSIRRAELIDNELGHNELYSKLQGLVDQLDNESWLHWLREVFDNEFVYEARSTNPSEGMGGSKLYRRDYSVNAETEEVTIAEEVEEVRQETNYVPAVQNAGATQTDTTVKEDTVTKEERVKALIACERTRFTEKNEEWLNTLDDCTLATLEAVEVKEPAPEPVKPVGNAAPPKADPGVDPTEGVKPVTLKEYVDKAPSEVQTVLNRAIARDAEVKANLVKGIVANKRNKFSEEELNSMSIEHLEGIAELANVAVDYSGKVGGVETHADENEIPEAPKLWKLDGTDGQK